MQVTQTSIDSERNYRDGTTGHKKNMIQLITYLELAVFGLNLNMPDSYLQNLLLSFWV